MNQLNFASLILDKPIVNQKSTFQISAGENLKTFLSNLEINPGFSFIILVNGVVNDGNYFVQAGDVIHCLPQITGG
jgi:hypothetical protein